LISKVCRLVWDYPRAGEASYGLQPVFTNLSEEQVRQGYEVHVISTRSPGHPEYENANGVNVHRVSTPFNLRALGLVRKLADSDREWVVHSHATAGLLMSATRRFRRIPLVSHVHGTSRSHHVPLRLQKGAIVVDYSSLSVNYSMFRERLLWSSADRVLTVSRDTMDDVTGVYRINPKAVRVVYNGVDPELFRPNPDAELPPEFAPIRDKRIILYVGHFGVRKGIFYLIRAMKKIRKEIPGAHLLCIGGTPQWLHGTGYWGLLRSEIEKSDVSSCVTLHEAVRNLGLANFYNSAEVFVLPSFYETFSKVTLEAMACAKPVVATRTGGLPEVVDDGKTGILVKFGLVDGLAQSVIEIMEDSAKSKEMGRLGREKVLRMFTWKGVVERITSVYKELAN
jgi:glycosyltransferase involved in cell wall biosynthesis